MSAADSSLDPQALHELYVHHHGWLYGWLRRRLGSSADAADLAQETFARLLAARTPPASLREPRAYLNTVARGLLVNWFQRQALERAYLEALAALPEACAPAPEQRLQILQTLQEIDALLDGLPGPVREAFLLAQLDGLRYADIARRLGVAEVTVKRYMKQAFLACLNLMD
ncbi:sigma-70 family RNA polymerase sigma factor [Pelomonas sp. CA6]|uniref:sigma-70 family RNA polymerase sigma factor n=1 Tax=Pelomonas sp. CA6 TaxID=2907999 RepID=UPI001F4AAB9A|nr:sigma-70 family RNA polymerase sigma factor [Pelomonas sp. CA6]MCH7342878.1 sigma-70 family RNA polymerase sigma factor [Pelomonas sp. CA6]